MRARDVERLKAFNKRMGMYINPQEQECVLAYLFGYQNGAGDECKFGEELSAHIKETYGIKPMARYWWGQIDDLAIKRSITWMEAYRLASDGMLAAAEKRLVK